MKKSKSLELKVVEEMRKDGKIREAGFSLHKDFTGDYGDFNVVVQKTTDENKITRENNFRLRCKSESGNHSLAGFMVVNALVVPKKQDLPKEHVKDAPGVFFFHDADEVSRNAIKFSVIMEETDGKAFDFPDKFKVIAALVGKDSAEDHPYIPLSRYPGYGLFQAHKAKINPEQPWVTREDIEYFMTLEGSDRPRGISKDYEFKLRNHDTAVWDMKMWMPTLVIEDWRDEE